MQASTILQTRPWRSRAFSMPKELRKYPTMLSPEEQLMLVFLGATLDFSHGEIVDLGPFMGGSTSAIGCGLNLVPGHGKTIHSFDMFAASEPQKKKFLYARGHPEFEGRNILPLFNELTRPYPVSATKGDIRKVNWDQPIALLFIDLSKSWSINDHVVQTFFPHLQRGAVIVQQDYMFYRNPWICSTMYKLRDRIRFAGQTDHNSMLFEMVRPLSAGDAARCTRAQTSAAEVEEAFDWTATLLRDNLGFEMLDAMRAAFRANPDGAEHDDFPQQQWLDPLGPRRVQLHATAVS